MPGWHLLFQPNYGKGIRNYLLLQYRLTHRMDIWLRWGPFALRQWREHSLGGETIAGDTRNDVKFQVRNKT